VDIIARNYSLANNDFLSAFYHSLDTNDIEPKISSTEYKIRMAMFTRLLDQISSSSRIISFLKSESLFDRNIQGIVDNTCRILLMRILPILSFTDVISIGLSVIKLKKYENIFFSLLIQFIEKYFSENKSSENEILITRILDFVYMISKEVSTIPILINIDCPIACLRWLSLSFLQSEEYKCILLILKNIVRHDEGIIILNEHKCKEIFTKFTKEILFTKIDYIIDNSMHRNLLFIMNMIIFSTTNPNAIGNVHNCKIIDQDLLPMITISLSSHVFMSMECRTSELLIIIMKLFTNDNILNYVLQKCVGFQFFSYTLKRILNATKDFCSRIIYGYEMLLSIIVLANIFWSISFQDQYKNKLIENMQLITECELFINSIISFTFLSRQIFPLRRAIDGIKQNLYPSKPTAIPTTRSLIISYSYADLDFYRKLHEILSKNSKLSISPDADNWKQRAQNIEQADLVLFLVSNNFFIDKSCRQELIYVRDILEKPGILIYIDRDYEPIGWLHERIDRLKSIHFGEGDFRDIGNDLLSMMNETLSFEKNSSDIKQWTDKEVKQWFTNHNLIPELHEFYQFQNGNELFLYAQAILAYPWTKEYERIRSRYEKKFHEQEKNLSPHEFLKFINALERIRH
jgi:hypothetical protein